MKRLKGIDLCLLDVLKDKGLKNKICTFFKVSYNIEDPKWHEALYRICLGMRDKDICTELKMDIGYLRHIKYITKFKLGCNDKYIRMSNLILYLPLSLWIFNAQQVVKERKRIKDKVKVDV